MFNLVRSMLGIKKEQPEAPATPQKRSMLLRLQHTCAHTVVAEEHKRAKPRQTRGK